MKPEKRGGGKGRGPEYRASKHHWRACERWRKRNAHLPPEEFGKCPNCGVKFIPIWLENLSKFSRVCATCAVKNLSAFLGVPLDEMLRGHEEETMESLNGGIK